MGALPPVSTWIPEDDRLLINAVKAGVSFESLAKGAVQFSRRFTVQELQDRWHALLCDPVVSSEASSLMMEFEHSASTTKSDPIRFEQAKESKKCVPEKRKAESIPSFYCPMHKRISNDTFDSVDADYLGGSGNNDDPQSVDCMFVDSLIDNFGNQESNFNIILNNVLEHGAGNSIYASDYVTAPSALPIGKNHNGDVSLGSFSFQDFPNGIEGTLSPTENREMISAVGGLSQPNEVPVSELLEAEDLEPILLDMAGQFDDDVRNTSSGYDSQVFTAAFPDSALSFQLPDFTIAGASVPTLPNFEHAEKELSIENTLVVPVHGGANKMDTSGYSIVTLVNSSSNLEDQISCDILRNSSLSTDDYLVELSNFLFNSKDDEEPLFVGPDRNEVIDESYFDDFSSFLLDTPDDTDNGVSEISKAPDQQLPIPDGARPGELSDKRVNHYGDKPIVCSSEVQMISSALSVNPAFPEMRDGVICCTLNTEVPEIPTNDDVFLPVRMPSIPSPLMAHHTCVKTYCPVSSIDGFKRMN
ncbi:PREDICTED: uncharacterized protein LOC109230976 [Nicotiana attenuata]|uniref:Microspherule protein N-terminal domain-containing protein n=1 Tax=Nicotiana attenuata TaxID=49451 RepID=A0A1J6IFL0_NICAT|nr:PREDICTED: uncharacterized protein LOC109230976 [Nicotiana attenuata]XP_019252030.1 PREDICTED: uncharacterized protein LOC109230976 [Nicotiana attenuata]XP_019252031.1 PREDICTED: uncharacterized protein LOC109230976 [Nicotiana attenuata]XP_019252032.1 PREDICTED: uncharacterized protein LOC109230976 [Nicotiana attenuata]XP_019252033.1 PREDICTED: uncharacterized protein LOC109230976 [Nicotiana attenuata]XP_019252035.1 PREDICTED: uncharacterized protein LOC109230976 [Nicotiana attenuata]XP_01